MSVGVEISSNVAVADVVRRILDARSIALATLPEVTDSQLTITGPAAPGIIIDGGGNPFEVFLMQGVQVMQVASGVTLNLKQLTIADGFSFDPGGGIRNDGTLTVSNSTFSGQFLRFSDATTNDVNLTKIGTGTFTLSGNGANASSYTGATTINAGILNLTGTLNGSGANITLNANNVQLTGGGTGIISARGVVVPQITSAPPAHESWPASMLPCAAPPVA